MQAPLTTREAWLTHFAEKFIWPRIEKGGARRPAKYRVSVGFPKGHRGSKGHSIGQCWSQEVSADQTCEIFISPDVAAALSDLKKSALAKAAEERLAGKGWLPASLRVNAT